MIYLEFSDLFGVLNIKMNNVLLLFDVIWFGYIFYRTNGTQQHRL